MFYALTKGFGDACGKKDDLATCRNSIERTGFASHAYVAGWIERLMLAIPIEFILCRYQAKRWCFVVTTSDQLIYLAFNRSFEQQRTLWFEHNVAKIATCANVLRKES